MHVLGRADFSSNHVQEVLLYFRYLETTWITSTL